MTRRCIDSLLTWSCLEQGLAYQPDDRVVQFFDGVVD